MLIKVRVGGFDVIYWVYNGGGERDVVFILKLV